jgi:hypothetical protein
MRPPKKGDIGYELTTFGAAVGEALYGYLRHKRIARKRFAEMPQREVNKLLGAEFTAWLRARSRTKKKRRSKLLREGK